MEHTEQMKKIKDNIFCEGIAVFTLSMACVDMFFVDFNLDYFADNIMWFVVMIFLIVSNVRSLVVSVNDYKYLKKGEKDE